MGSQADQYERLLSTTSSEMQIASPKFNKIGDIKIKKYENDLCQMHAGFARFL